MNNFSKKHFTLKFTDVGMSSFRNISIAILLATGMSVPAFANDPIQRTNTTSLWFENWGSLKNAYLKVLGPDGTLFEVRSEAGSPTFELRELRPVADGVYRYELTAATNKTQEIKNSLNNGRGDAERKEEAIPFQTAGFFIVSRGVITKKENIVEE